MTTTRSDVFTVHMASLFKRNEENRVFVLRRSASLLVRLEDGEESRLGNRERFLLVRFRNDQAQRQMRLRQALGMARRVAEGSGPWVAEGEWVAGLAAWRLADCAAALGASVWTALIAASTW